MFTQIVMQGFRSVFVALLVISVFPMLCVADESKIDARVRTALQTQSTVAVAISLKDKPPCKEISDAVAADLEPNIEAKAAEIRNRIRPFTRQNRALPPNVRAEVRVMHESLDRQTGQMRREIGRQLKNYVAASQQLVRTAIEDEEGTVYAEVAISNVIGAQLSDSAVTEIAALDEVERIELDPVVAPDLADSAKIIYAPRFWDAGSDGSYYDVGIVEPGGVEDEHPQLRSKAAGKLIESHPDDAEAIADPKKIDHGTAVAGIVAKKPPYTPAEYKGIAHGLETILDATGSSFEDMVEAAEWAMTNASEAADVVNLSLSALPKDIMGKYDYTMDQSDPDYKFGKKLDSLIECYKTLIIKSAGNYSTSTKMKYTLGWGSDSYNAIIVGASTASGDNEPRAKNKVRLTSSRGPTPELRKKPDVVAPGENILTTDRGGTVGTFSGTSAAAPHVTGAILLFADHGLWDPMRQKALLINSAEDRGDAGWDKDWGWGYIDLYTALEQIDYTIRDTIEGRPEYDYQTNRGVKWYTGTMTGCQTATLVWHIHEGRPLANLDMVLYNANGQKLDSSASIRDNVEQVKMPEGQDGTVYIKIVYDVPYGYGPPETFGLALPSSFSSMGPPRPSP